jgi:hypothetical protein
MKEAADAVKLSAGHRLLIWSFVGDRIAEGPLAGWGFDASRAMPGGKDLIRPGQTWMPLHPHDAPLQLWLELGVPGAVLFALIVALVWFALADIDWPRLFAAAAGASLMAALVVSFASYGIWEEWWLDTLWFFLFAIIVMARAARPTVMPTDHVGPQKKFAGRLRELKWWLGCFGGGQVPPRTGQTVNFANLAVRSVSIRWGTRSMPCVSRGMTLWPKISATGLVLLQVPAEGFASLTSAVVPQLSSGTWNQSPISSI